MSKPEVKVLIPRPELDLLGSTSDLVGPPKDLMDFPSVPTAEPRLVDLESLAVVREPVETRIAVPEGDVQPEPEMMQVREELVSKSPIPTPPPEAEVAPKKLAAVFVADNSVDDGHVFPAGVEFVKSWRVLNNGAVAWPESTVIAFMGGDRLGVHEKSGRDAVEYHVGRVEPGAEVDVQVEDMKAPAIEGRYVSYWCLKDTAAGAAFGDRLWCE